MTVFEYIKNSTVEEFADFCYKIYNLGWFDGVNSIDDEEWIRQVVPFLENEVFDKIESDIRKQR